MSKYSWRLALDFRIYDMLSYALLLHTYKSHITTNAYHSLNGFQNYISRLKHLNERSRMPHTPLNTMHRRFCDRHSSHIWHASHPRIVYNRDNNWSVIVTELDNILNILWPMAKISATKKINLAKAGNFYFIMWQHRCRLHTEQLVDGSCAVDSGLVARGIYDLCARVYLILYFSNCFKSDCVWILWIFVAELFLA
jgi:hypothetical protein